MNPYLIGLPSLTIGVFYLTKNCTMAVKKIFTGTDGSSEQERTLEVKLIENQVFFELDTQAAPAAWMFMDEETLNELVQELYRLKKKIDADKPEVEKPF